MKFLTITTVIMNYKLLYQLLYFKIFLETITEPVRIQTLGRSLGANQLSSPNSGLNRFKLVIGSALSKKRRSAPEVWRADHNRDVDRDRKPRKTNL